MLRQKLIINIWLLHLVGFLSLHTLLKMRGHRNLKIFSILLLTRYDQLFLCLGSFPRVVLYIYYFSLDFFFHFSILNLRMFPCLRTQPFLYDFLIRHHFCNLLQHFWIDSFSFCFPRMPHSMRHATHLYFSMFVRFFYRPFNLDFPCLLFLFFVRILVFRLLKFSDS